MDYADYHPDFRTVARWIIHQRAGNRCEHCGVHNNSVGHWQRTRKGERPIWRALCGNSDLDAYGWGGQYTYGQARRFAADYNEAHRMNDAEPLKRVVKLACAHLDQDHTHVDPDRLAALCQGCHRHHDSLDNAERRKYGETGQHHFQLRLFADSRYAFTVFMLPKPKRQKRAYRRKNSPIKPTI